MARRESLLAPPDPAPIGQSRLRGSHRLLRATAGAATAVTFLLVAVGALVRATGSGDACPDWPKCFGRWVPSLEEKVIIEYSHRLTASVAVLLVVVLGLVAARRYRRIPRVVVPAFASAGLVLLQAAIGGVVVLRELRGLDVTLHLGTAMLLVGSLVLTTVGAMSIDLEPQRPNRLTWMARGSAAAVLALILLGAAVRAEGAGLAFADWPLMQGRLVPHLPATAAALHFAHRALALLTGATVIWLALRAWRGRTAEPWTAGLAGVAAGLFVGQVMVGAAAVWTRLSAPAVITHVALSSLIWGSLVATAAASRLPEASRRASTGTTPEQPR